MRNGTFGQRAGARVSAEPVSDRSAWDTFVDQSPNSQLFHRWDFLKVVEKYTGYRLYTYGIYRGDELVSVIPLFHKRKKGLSFVYSPPQATLSYIPYLGFALSPGYYCLAQSEKEALMDRIVAETASVARRFSPNYTSFAVAPGDVDTRPYLRNGFETELQYTYTFDLRKPLGELWDSLEKQCRSHISAASKLNLSLRQSRDARALFDIMRGRLTSEGSTFFHRQSPEYLEAMLAAFPDNLKLYFLYHGDEIVGADVNYEYKGRCTSWMGTAVVKEGFSANEYLLWELIKRAREAGFSTYENLGADELRLNLFKAKFNPDLVPYFYVTKKDPWFKVASYGSEKVARILGR